MDEMWLLNSRLLSKIIPRLHEEPHGDRVKFRKFTEEFMTFDRCCGVPINKCSVLDMLIERRFVRNQESILSRAADNLSSD